MKPDSDIKQDVSEIRDSVESLTGRVDEHLETAPVRERFARIERIQIAVAVAIVTGFISLVAADLIATPDSFQGCFRPSTGYSCAISLQAILAMLFLLGKTGTMTARPIFEIENIQRIDEYWLPAFYIPLLGFSILAAILLIMTKNSAPPGFIAIYMAAEVLVFHTLGRRYAEGYEEAMSQIDLRSPGKSVSVSGGPQGGTDAFIIRNESDQDYRAGEIEFKVNSPEGVSIRIESQAVPGDDANVWEFVRPLKIGNSRRIPIEIQIDRDIRGTPFADTYEITVLHCGEAINTESVAFYG